MAQQRLYGNDYFTREWKVAGLWNTILHEALPAINPAGIAGWQISPEGQPDSEDTQSFRADLVVSTLEQNAANQEWNTGVPPVIHFEAKKGSGGGVLATGGAWTKVRKQIENWCDNSLGVKAGTPCWAIGAIGSEVKFWIYTTSIEHGGTGGQKSKMVPVYCQHPPHGGPGTLAFNWAIPWQNGTTADQQAAISYRHNDVPFILNQMFTHPWASQLTHANGGIGNPGGGGFVGGGIPW